MEVKVDNTAVNVKRYITCRVYPIHQTPKRQPPNPKPGPCRVLGHKGLAESRVLELNGLGFEV